MSTDSPTPPPPPFGLPVRFSLRTLLIGTTCFALWCGFVSLLPDVLTQAFTQLMVGGVWIVATSWLVIGVVFGRDDQRAFCLGALLVVSSMWTGFGGQFMNGYHQLLRIRQPWALWTDFILIAVTATANGRFCIWARRFFERQSGR
jgi:hypothetical protein